MAGHLNVPTAQVDGDMTVVLPVSAAPLSGTSGTGANTYAAPGCLIRNTANGVVYVNEGTLASPYWTPVNFGQRGLLAYRTDFRSGLGKALADTGNAAVIADGTGIRVHGQGIEETDSGLTVAFAEGGPVASLVATNEDAHLAAIGAGDTAVQYQPDTHGPLVIDATVAMSSALTLRRFFIGFLGTSADLLDPPATGSTTTITLVQDDLAGIFMDAGLTAATALLLPSNKSDAAASQTVASATPTVATVFPAAGTYIRLRVEISAAGAMTAFADKAQIGTVSAALDVDEEVQPSLLIGSTSAATKTMLVKEVSMWGNRA